MNKQILYWGDKIEVKNIDIKLNNLLKWGFVPAQDYLINPSFTDFGNVCNYDSWNLDGSFVSDYCPYEGFDVKNQKHGFRLKASLIHDSVHLFGWYDEVWGEYTMVKPKTNNWGFVTPVFDKSNVKSEISKIKNSRLVQFENDNPKGVLYLLKANQYTKIGISIRPLDRQKNIGTKLPFTSEVLRHYLFDKKDLKLVESRLHNFFAKKRTNGEWFKLSDDDVLFIDFLVETGRTPKTFFEYKNYDKFIKYKNYKSNLAEIRKQCLKSAFPKV